MVSTTLKLAVVGAGVAGAYMMNRLPAGVEAEAFEMRTEKNWYTVCAWGTSQPFIRDMVKQAGFNFDDYVLHKGKKMRVDLGDDELNINLTGLVTYDKHRLTEDMLKGKKVHWGAQVKEANGNLAGFDKVVDATGLQRSLLPKIKDDLVVPSLEYQVKSKKLPYDDFVIKPYPGLCVTGETLVMTNPGTKPIREVRAGDRILTMAGWTDVTKTYNRKHTGEVFEITPYLCDFPVGLTPGHLVWVMDRKSGKVGWKEAQNLRECHGKRSGDYVAMPIPSYPDVHSLRVSDHTKGLLVGEMLYPMGRNQFEAEFAYRQPIKNEIKATPELGEFFGLYISQGNAFHNGIILSNYNPTIMAQMKGLGERLFGIEGKQYVPHQIQFNSTLLRRMFVELFGEGAYNKRIPRIALGFPRDVKLALIRGLFRGEGCRERKGYDFLSYTTKSRGLAIGLWQLLLNVGVVSSVSHSRSSRSFRVRASGRQLEMLGDIFGQLKLAPRVGAPRKYLVRDGVLYFAVRKVHRLEAAERQVYDLETNGSYTTSFVVHNCGYWWYFPLGEGVAHVGAGDIQGRYRYELDDFVKKYDCEVLRRIGRPVRVTPPKFAEPFFDGKVVGVGESIGTVYPMLGEGIIPSMQCVNLFVDHLDDREGYRRAVLDHFAIYAKVYEFIRAKVENRFSLIRMWPTLLSIYWYMRENEKRYGLQTRMSDFYKIATRL